MMAWVVVDVRVAIKWQRSTARLHKLPMGRLLVVEGVVAAQCLPLTVRRRQGLNVARLVTNTVKVISLARKAPMTHLLDRDQALHDRIVLETPAPRLSVNPTADRVDVTMMAAIVSASMVDTTGKLDYVVMIALVDEMNLIMARIAVGVATGEDLLVTGHLETMALECRPAESILAMKEVGLAGMDLLMAAAVAG
jgi:hypothetical protein